MKHKFQRDCRTIEKAENNAKETLKEIDVLLNNAGAPYRGLNAAKEKISKLQSALINDRMSLEYHYNTYINAEYKNKVRQNIKSGKVILGLMRHPITAPRALHLFFKSEKSMRKNYDEYLQSCESSIKNLDAAIREYETTYKSAGRPKP